MNKPVFKRPRKLEIADEPKELLLELFTMLIAFAITPVKFFFSTYPFGLALCASCKKRAPFALAGSALSAIIFMENSVPYVIALLALVGMRLAGSVWLHDNGEREVRLGQASRPSFVSLLFTEKLSVRVALCALCALGLGVYRVIASAYSYYEIFVLIFLCVFCSVLCYALCSLFDEGGRDRVLGICSLLFIFVYAIRGREIFGLDISMVLSYASILYASKYVSGTKSTALGVLLGLCHGVAFAPVFALGALVSSLLWSFSYYLAIISALVMSIGYGVFASGYQAIVYLLPELLLASLVMYPLTRFEIIPRPSFLLDELGGVAPSRQEEHSTARDAMLEASESLKEISGILDRLSERTKAPSRDFYRDASLEICERHCFGCPKRSICWERDPLTTKDNISRMGDQAFTLGAPSADGIDEKFLHRCPNIELIFDELSALSRDTAKNATRVSALEVISQDYSLMSRLIEELFLSAQASSRPNSTLCDKVIRTCDRLGLKYSSAEVLGAQDVKITLSSVKLEASKCSSEELALALEEALEMSLTTPQVTELDGEAKITLCSAPTLLAECRMSVAGASEDEENGDTLCEFSTSNNKFYALLCDGMGSGRDAKSTSALCASLMQSLLGVCPSKELCLCMLNSFVRAKGLECSSSVDLLEIDLIGGSACLVKSGAAPSFIKRGSSVFRLHSRTAPIGIMKELDAEKLDFSLRDGDIVVMISDGIASDEKDSKYLVDFLSRVEICESEDEIIDTSPTEAPKKESLAPANSRAIAPRPSVLSPQGDDEGATKLTFDALPSAIMALAKAKSTLHRDDMSVFAIKVNRYFNP